MYKVFSVNLGILKAEYTPILVFDKLLLCTGKVICHFALDVIIDWLIG